MDTLIEETTTKFSKSYRDVDWGTLIKSSENTIEIAVFYWDKWVSEFSEEWKMFFSKQKTKVRLYLSDPTYPEVIKGMARLFPKHSIGNIHEKVWRTQHYLMKLAENEEQVECYLYPNLHNYSLQCFDFKTVVLSVFENFREKPVDSPAFLFELTEQPEMKEFVSKELQGIHQNSEKRVLTRVST